jgi:ABC-type sugar transport system ATPase subunit
MTLGDRIVVMSGGRVQQIGRPQDVYRHPANLFVAGFIGSPAMNLVRGAASDGGVVAGELRFAWQSPPAGEVAVGIRPECLTPADDGRPWVELRVDVVEPLGEQVVVHGTVAGTPVHSGAEDQDEIPLTVEGARAPMTAIFAAVREPAPGDVLRLGVAPDRIHLFDMQSGEAIPGSAA